MAVATQQPSLAKSPSAPLRARLTRPFLYAVLFVVGFLALAPFVWMVLASVKSFGDFAYLDFSTPATTLKSFWPWPPFGDSAPAFSNYAEAADLIDRSSQYRAQTGIPLLLRQFFNTALISFATVTGVLITACLAAYAFAMLEFPGKRVLFIGILAALMIPEELVLVPRVIMMYEPLSAEARAAQDAIISLIPRTGWQNTFFALTLPFMASAFAIFLLRQYFMQVPKDLYDAARIDGSGHLRYLRMMMVPLAMPAIVTIGLLTFIGAWNEFKWTQLVTRDLSMRTISVGLQNFLQGDGGSQGQLAMAVAVVVVTPIVVLYLFTQKYFVEGVAKSGVK